MNAEKNFEAVIAILPLSVRGCELMRGNDVGGGSIMSEETPIILELQSAAASAAAGPVASPTDWPLIDRHYFGGDEPICGAEFDAADGRARCWLPSGHVRRWGTEHRDFQAEFFGGSVQRAAAHEREGLSAGELARADILDVFVSDAIDQDSARRQGEAMLDAIEHEAGAAALDGHSCAESAERAYRRAFRAEQALSAVRAALGADEVGEEVRACRARSVLAEADEQLPFVDADVLLAFSADELEILAARLRSLQVDPRFPNTRPLHALRRAVRRIDEAALPAAAERGGSE